MNADAPARPHPRSGRPLRLVAILAALALALVLAVGWLLQPQRAVGFLLARVSSALGLEITASGAVEYRLRGTPQVVVRDLVAREPGATAPILRAQRVLLALPWSTIRARGNDLTVTRIELDAPVFDLPAFQHWQATRPPSETRVPTLTNGLRIRDGMVANDDWRIQGLAVDIAELHPERMLRMRVRGRYLDPPLSIPADLAIAVANPLRLAKGSASGVAGVGALDFAGDGWRVPSKVTLSGPLRLGKDSALVKPMAFGMAARYESASTKLPFVLGLHGPMSFNNATWRVVPMQAVLRGGDTMPDLRGRGSLSLGRQLRLHLGGEIAAWPAGWPALPPPLAQSNSPLPFALDYTGRMDLADVASLELQRDDTRFEGRFRTTDITAWANAETQGSPLPPLSGRLGTPRLDIAGATLEGVEVELDDPDLPPAKK
ncbi:hypothetical protein FNZ56_05585 [Pseudoluteimonas lycopersici]|uniref:AsmA family protein n=1 Tax=Pseudoluteimonas lycopersici TaxID=1324796 RepID=A0A516V4B3_9GAMM|nr:hypothetical protein [Lysobacter lycopersici]QDQ73380.1 hypothetical protein FNZ56_05585 [Lysobacter lycopersici]